MMAKLSALTISLISPVLFASFYEPVTNHFSLTTQSTDPGGGGRIDVIIRSKFS